MNKVIEREREIKIDFDNKNRKDIHKIDIKILNKKIKIKKGKINNNKLEPKKECKLNELSYYKFEHSKTLVEDSHSTLYNNTFSIFKSIDNIFYLIYTNKNKSIISFNLINYKKISEIKNAHKRYITSFRYKYDKVNNKDIIMSVSGEDNNIKLWNTKNWECLHNFENIYSNGIIYSACFLDDNINIYIISSNWISYFMRPEPIKVFDLNGNKIKEINDSKENIFLIDSFYDNKLSKNYIVIGKIESIKSFDFIENKKYREYTVNDRKDHSNFIINDNENIIKLIESSWDGNVRIWNFHSGELLKTIQVNNQMYGICLYKNNHLCLGCKPHSIKLIDLNKDQVIIKLLGHLDSVITIKSLFHPKYGECLISQSNDKTIKLWMNII